MCIRRREGDMTESINAVRLSPGLENASNNYHHISAPVEKTPEAEHKTEVSPKESVDRAVKALEAYIDSHERSLDISVYEATGDIIVKVISEKDGKVIREIPPEELLDCAARMKQLEGILFNKNA
jgi:uncharacterized FlaG/YvyC family protein